MAKTYEERFLEEYINCDREKELYEKRIKKYKQMIDTLKQEDIKNIIDEALKEQTSLVLSYLKIDKVKLEYSTKKLIEKFSSETIYDKLNNNTYYIEHYYIPRIEEYKKLLLQIKNLGLMKNYFDSIDIESKIGFFKCKLSPYKIFKILTDGYKNTDYISELKNIMNEEFYTKCLNAEIVFIENYSREPFGLHFEFETPDYYEIIPESMRINNLEDVIQININGQCLYSYEEMKNIGKYIIKGHNDVYLGLKNTPNKINRSIVCLAKVK